MQRANSESIEKRHLYWFSPDAFASLKLAAPSHGIKLTTTVLTPCQVLRVSPGQAIYAPPSVWSRMCVRQGSWYRDSQRAGQYMVMSAERLPAMFDQYLDAEVAESDFVPASLPGNADLEGLGLRVEAGRGGHDSRARRPRKDQGLQRDPAGSDRALSRPLQRRHRTAAHSAWRPEDRQARHGQTQAHQADAQGQASVSEDRRLLRRKKLTCRHHGAAASGKAALPPEKITPTRRDR